MATETFTRELRLFGVAEATLRQELADMLESALSGTALSYCEGEGRLTLAAANPEDLEEMTDLVLQRLGPCVYSIDGESLEQQVVRLLARHGKTVATAESCTGGLVSARLTAVPGSSRVFGTGVVSYSPDCKQALLGVSSDTLAAEGTVCAAVAGQMARGVRQTAGADIGVAVTGEAGPQAAEAVPVGTVFVALADARRTWVCELHLDGERNAIRRESASQVLYLLYRYLEAYPTVMAGGVSHRVVERTIPRTEGETHPRLHTRLLPWRGDSLGKILIKCLVWLAIAAFLVGGVYLGYRYLVAPDNNRQLQDELGNLYWDTEFVDGDTGSGEYPPWLLAQFRGLYAINNQVAGWIQIPGTAVDCPITFYCDGYYKNHNFSGQYSVYGQPYFAETSLLSAQEQRALTVYGKSIGDGQMFSDLLGYRRLAYLQEHPLIEMNTVLETGRWEIFAVLVVDERNREECDYARSLFADDEEFAAYITMLRERSLFHSSLTVTAEDELLLLSVNAEDVYDYAAARLVVAARRTEATESGAVYKVNNRAVMPAVLAEETTTHPTRTTRTTTRSTTTTITTGTTIRTTTTESAVTETTESEASTEPTLPTEPTGDVSIDDQPNSTATTVSGEPVSPTTEDASAADPVPEETERIIDDHIGD